MSIFNLSTGKKAETNGSFEMGGSSKPIPDGSELKSAITEAGWKEYEGVRYINLRWDVLDGEYKKRVIFQKVKVYDPDPKKADRQRNMLAAIDANCGGKLQQIEGEPSDIDLLKCLANRPVVIRVGVWELDNGNNGNWITAVRSSGKVSQSAKKQDAESEKKSNEQSIEEDIIPF